MFILFLIMNPRSMEDLRISGGLFGLEGANRTVGKWSKSSSLKTATSTGKLISVGSDGRGGRVKVLRDHGHVPVGLASCSCLTFIVGLYLLRIKSCLFQLLVLCRKRRRKRYGRRNSSVEPNKVDSFILSTSLRLKRDCFVSNSALISSVVAILLLPFFFFGTEPNSKAPVLIFNCKLYTH